MLSTVVPETEEVADSAKPFLPRLVLGRSNSSFFSLIVFLSIEVIGLPLPWVTGSSLLPRVVGVGVGGVEVVEASGFDFNVSWIFGFSLVLGTRSSSSLSERRSRRSSKSSEIEKKFQI